MTDPITPDDRGLAWAIAQVVRDFRDEARDEAPDETAGVDDVVRNTREYLDLDDIRTLRQPRGYGSTPDEPLMDADTAQAYRQVLTADDDAFTPDLTSAAENLLITPDADSVDEQDPVGRARDAVAALPAADVLAAATDDATEAGCTAQHHGDATEDGAQEALER